MTRIGLPTGGYRGASQSTFWPNQAVATAGTADPGLPQGTLV